MIKENKILIILSILMLLVFIGNVSANDIDDTNTTIDQLTSDTESIIINNGNAEIETSDISNVATNPDESIKNSDSNNIARLDKIANDINDNQISQLKEDSENLIYVFQYGPNEGDGTLLKSFKNIKLALDSIKDDKSYTIVLREGNYSGINNTNLVIKDNIKIVNYQNDRAIIDFGQSTSNKWNITGDNVLIKGIEFTNINNGLNFNNTSNSTIDNCSFYKSYYYNSCIINATNSELTIKNTNMLNLSGSTSYRNYGINSNSSNITLFNNTFDNNAVNNLILLNNSIANISNNVFNSMSGSSIIETNRSNLTISNNEFNKKTTGKSAIILNLSNVEIINNTFNNISVSSSGYASSISTFNSNASIIDNTFKNNYGYTGGAIYVNSSNNKIINNTFDSNSGIYGGSINNNGESLYLEGNVIKNSTANYGNEIYNTKTVKSATLIVLNNETVTEDYKVNASIFVVDDMGNKITGHVRLTLNNTVLNSSLYVGDNTTIEIQTPGKGEYVLGGTYLNATTVETKTGTIIFNKDPFKGPYYVDPNGDDSNVGSEENPFKTIQAAIKEASKTNNNNTIFIKEGTYNEHLTISTGLNIIGLGNVTFDGNNSRIISVSGAYTNISNINFVNGNYSSGGAIYWTGNYGKLENCNITDCYSTNGGAIYWSGYTGTIKNCNIENCSANYGGGIYVYGSVTLSNNTIENCSSRYGNSYGNQIYKSGTINNAT
ncbi:MAG: DUF1565 domain-containing protein, partial [archaeon]|nr:DUF1565 domain-containing protein [archaeon]